MAININLTGLTNTDGEQLSSAHIRIGKFENFDEATIRLDVMIWRTETDYLAGKREIWVEEIPQHFRNLTDSLTAIQFANVDNNAIQTKLASMLELGTGHTKTLELFPRLTWGGLGTGTTTVVMPS